MKILSVFFFAIVLHSGCTDSGKSGSGGGGDNAVVATPTPQPIPTMDPVGTPTIAPGTTGGVTTGGTTTSGGTGNLLPAGCYRVGPTGFLSRGDGTSCAFLGSQMASLCNGQTNFYNLTEYTDHKGNNSNFVCQ